MKQYIHTKREISQIGDNIYIERYIEGFGGISHHFKIFCTQIHEERDANIDDNGYNDGDDGN